MSQYIIIAGTPKAGTTSLFRYLSVHPMICPSFVKETNILSLRYDKVNSANKVLDNAFNSSCKDKIKLEASPGYFINSEQVSSNIEILKLDATILIVLRNPKDYLLSFFLHRKNKTDDFSDDATYSDYIKAYLSEDFGSKIFKNKEVGKELIKQANVINYSIHLEKFKSSSNCRLKIIFFDDLIRSPRLTVLDIIHEFGFDCSCYNDYVFRTENKTRNLRNIWLHRRLHKIIMKSEFFLNKYPKIREFIRKIYYFFNESSKSKNNMDSTLSSSLDKQLNEKISLLNFNTRNWLADNGFKLELPDWLV